MKSNHPDKELVREYLQRRREKPGEPKEPVPTPEQIRRELGWNLTDRPQTPQDKD